MYSTTAVLSLHWSSDLPLTRWKCVAKEVLNTGTFTLGKFSCWFEDALTQSDEMHGANVHHPGEKHWDLDECFAWWSSSSGFQYFSPRWCSYTVYLMSDAARHVLRNEATFVARSRFTFFWECHVFSHRVVWLLAYLLHDLRNSFSLL